jgi:hypothetical protein
VQRIRIIAAKNKLENNITEKPKSIMNWKEKGKRKKNL